MTTITRLVLTVIVVSLPVVSLFAQSKCLSPDEAKTILEQVNLPRPDAFNKNLREELLKLAGKSEKLIYNSIEEDRSNDNSRKRIDEARQQDNARLCQVLKDFGWPTSGLVGPDGLAAIPPLGMRSVAISNAPRAPPATFRHTPRPRRSRAGRQ